MRLMALVVDDSVSMRRMVAYTLAQAGLTVVEAGDGQAALAQLERTYVDLIISDVNMPVLDGYGLVRAVRARPEHRATPILMLTTDADQASKSAARAAGATGWMVKPFDPQRLLQVVRQVLPAAVA